MVELSFRPQFFSSQPERSSARVVAEQGPQGVENTLPPGPAHQPADIRRATAPPHPADGLMRSSSCAAQIRELSLKWNLQFKATTSLTMSSRDVSQINDDDYEDDENYEANLKHP
ncbi:hypothetical protein FSST1_006243 [Fusarium sambucinum]